MKVAIQARLKNGILYEAAKKMGSQSALARHLGVSPMEMGGWINFNRSAISVAELGGKRKGRSPEFWQEVENKLFELTGHTLEEIFPPEVRTQGFLNRQKKIEAVVELPMEMLMAAGAVPQLAPAPDDLLLSEDRTKVLDHVLHSLKPREEKVIRLRFGLGGEDEHILDEVAAKMGVTRERIRQIETKALRKLRHPTRTRHLLKG